MSNPQFKFLGVGLNVSDLDKSVDFYTRLLGAQEVQRYEFTAMTEVVLRWSDDAAEAGLVLVWQGSRPEPLVIGTGFSRVMAFVPDVRQLCNLLAEEGVEVGDPIEIDIAAATLAFAKDPDGYPIELIQGQLG